MLVYGQSLYNMSKCEVDLMVNLWTTQPPQITAWRRDHEHEIKIIGSYETNMDGYTHFEKLPFFSKCVAKMPK